MRGLFGDFATMSLKDLVVYLGNRQASGTLTLEREGSKKSVVLEQGEVVNASSNSPREYLGQFLINLGHITEEQFQRAFATQKETKVFLGRILVMIGLVQEDVVQTALATKFRETVLEAFQWPVGSFAFEPEKRPPMMDGLDVRVSLVEVHKESDFRAQAWQQIREVFPSGDCTLGVKVENLAEPLRAGSIDSKIIRAIDAGQTLDEMALNLHATDFFLYQRLYALFRLGALEVKPPGPGMKLDIDVDLGLGDSPTPEQILENARAFNAQGNYRDAFSLARRSHAMSPSQEASLLLKQIEVTWHPVLKEAYVGKGLVPTLAMGLDAMKSLPLSAPERYLLSRVDGKRDLDSITRVAPLREFEALAFFDRFAAQGWVKLAPP